MALENVMRVNKGKIIGGGTPESYPADKVIMSDGTTSVEDAIDDLNSSLVGVNIGSRTGSSDSISISGLSFNELEVVVYQTPDNVVTMNIPRRALSEGTTRYFRAGGYASSAENAMITIQVSGLSSIKLHSSMINSSNVTSTSIIEVYIK